MYAPAGRLGFVLFVLLYYLAVPICILFLAMYAAIITGLCIGVGPEPKHPACLAAFVVACLALVWLTYILPRFDHLIVHDYGFRIRILGKNLTARFDDVAEWRVGFVPGKLEGALRRFALPEDRDLARSTDAASIVVTLTDGTRRAFRNFFRRYDETDLGRFLGVLMDCCGQRVVVDPWHESSVRAPPGRGAASKRCRFLSRLGWLHLLGVILCLLVPAVAWFEEQPKVEEFDVPSRTYKQIRVGMTITDVELLVKRDRAFGRPRNLPGQVVEYHWMLDDGTQTVVRFQKDRLVEKRPEG